MVSCRLAETCGSFSAVQAGSALALALSTGLEHCDTADRASRTLFRAPLLRWFVVGLYTANNALPIAII